MLKQILSAIKISALALSLSLGLSYALAAWAPPTQQPPNGNVDAPINVGADDQIKTGDICTSKGGTTKCLSVVSSAIDPAPIGSVVSFAGTTPPSGYLLCNGAAISRTTYAALFTAIGTTFGVGDGSTTFNLPDLRGEFIRGLDNGRGVDAGRTLGSAQSQDLQSHTHSVYAQSPANYSYSTTGGGQGLSGNRTTTATGGTETRPRNVAMNYIIKAVNNSEMVLVQSGTGDNLGNHTATQEINMNGQNITSVNNITATGNGAATFGPNSSWGAYLAVGGNGRTTTNATVAATNGNLHLDARNGGYGTYLNWYASGTTGVHVGNGATGYGPIYVNDVYSYAAGKWMSQTASVGVGQTWQTVTGSRALNTTYTNNTGRPIFVSISMSIGGNSGGFIYVDGAERGRFYASAANAAGQLTAIVPAGSTYYATPSPYGGALVQWSELR